MEWKKNIDTNLGITIILVIAAIFTIVDFYVVGAHIDGYPFDEFSKNTEGKAAESKGVALLSEEEAMKIGEELYEKACKSYYGIYETKDFSENNMTEYVYYSKLQDNSFQIDELGSYKKLLVDDMKKVFASEEFDSLYYMKSAYYVVGSDSNYYMESLGVGGNPTYIDSKLSIADIRDDVIMFNVSSYYNVEDYNDLDEMKESKFVIKKENGEWKVSDFTIPF